jgi:hypothetical protein
MKIGLCRRMVKIYKPTATWGVCGDVALLLSQPAHEFMAWFGIGENVWRNCRSYRTHMTKLEPDSNSTRAHRPDSVLDEKRREEKHHTASPVSKLNTAKLLGILNTTALSATTLT